MATAAPGRPDEADLVDILRSIDLLRAQGERIVIVLGNAMELNSGVFERVRGKVRYPAPFRL